MIEYTFKVLISEFGYITHVVAGSLYHAAILGHAKYLQEQKDNAKEYRYQVDVDVNATDRYFHDGDRVTKYRFIEPVKVAL